MLIRKEKGRTFIFLCTAILFLFFMLAAMMNSQVMSIIDRIVVSAIPHGSNFLHIMFSAVSFVAKPAFDLVYVILLTLILWGMNYRITAVWSLGYGVIGYLLGTIVKHLVKRPRPIGHLLTDTGYSFPSGHVLGTFMVMAILFIGFVPFVRSKSKRLLIQFLLCIWVILVMMSRVYLQAHFPTDTIGAVLLAYAWLQVSEMLYVKWAPKLKKKTIFSESYM